MDKQRELEILCATMNQTDFSKLREMNIRNCDVVFTNQSGRYGYEEIHEHLITARMLTTATRGVGKNRNLALALAQGEILLFADDDLTYEENVAETISRAYRKFPEADMIIFGIRYTKQGKVFYERVPEDGKLPFFKALRYGTCVISIRRWVVLKYNLHFTELFGGGCLYSYGEDTDFIVQCFKKKLKIYSYGEIIASSSKDLSTCNTGYGEKYFFDKGALARYSLGIMAIPYILRMSRKQMESELNWWKRMKLLWNGYISFPALVSYDEWKRQHEKNNYRE